jgi:predicted nucleotidyltransferase
MSMGRRETLREKQILSRSVRVLRESVAPKRIYLFGSRAKGRSAPGADFDLAVDGRRPGPRLWRQLEEQLDEIAGLHQIDLVFLPDVSKEFRTVVLQSGKLLYEK